MTVDSTHAKKDTFIEEVNGFFLSLIGGALQAVKQLVELQENHSDEYELFKKAIESEDLEPLLQNLDDNTKKEMLWLLLQQSKLMYKMARVYSLSLAEKKELVNGLTKFIDSMKSFMDNLKGGD